MTYEIIKPYDINIDNKQLFEIGRCSIVGNRIRELYTEFLVNEHNKKVDERIINEGIKEGVL